jgi:hypothetical protein
MTTQNHQFEQITKNEEYSDIYLQTAWGKINYIGKAIKDFYN